MENIKNYLTKYNIDRISKNEYFFRELKDIFGNNLPSYIVEQYNNCNILNFSYIHENLNTHDSEKLQDKLLKEFPNIINGFKIYKDDKNKQSFFILYNNDKKYQEYLELKHNEKFNNILQFFNYYITGKYFIPNYEKCFLIEPRYSKLVRNELEINHTRLYHFTDCESSKSILKNGLRCKSSSYREFPERIFLWATNERLFTKDNKLKKNIWEHISNIVDKIKITKFGLSILRIDLYNRDISDINIYSDTAMLDSEAVFVYNNISKEYIKEIKQIKIPDDIEF